MKVGLVDPIFFKGFSVVMDERIPDINRGILSLDLGDPGGELHGSK